MVFHYATKLELQSSTGLCKNPAEEGTIFLNVSLKFFEYIYINIYTAIFEIAFKLKCVYSKFIYKKNNSFMSNLKFTIPLKHFMITVKPVICDLPREQWNIVKSGRWSLNTSLIDIKCTEKGNEN